MNECNVIHESSVCLSWAQVDVRWCLCWRSVDVVLMFVWCLMMCVDTSLTRIDQGWSCVDVRMMSDDVCMYMLPRVDLALTCVDVRHPRWSRVDVGRCRMISRMSPESPSGSRLYLLPSTFIYNNQY